MSDTASIITNQQLIDSHRPQFHFLPPRNWMNDPNGLIQWNGTYHLFYQYNPNGAFHGTIHWGHATSEDLIHWRHLPLALSPTPGGPDKDGCWSGCIVDHDGVPVLFYTGISPEVQCVAIGSADLVHWQKHKSNPVIAAPPDDLDLFGFRDPNLLKVDDKWYMVIGAGIRGVGGAVLLYRSDDLLDWTYLGPLLVDDSGLPDEMWECPTLFPLGDKYVLLISVTPRASVEYFIGDFRDGRFIPEVRRKLDHSRYFYAPQTLLDNLGRRILISWIWEGRSVDKDKEAGWSGIQSIPRVLTMCPDGHLGMEPVSELKQLRDKHRSFQDVHLSPEQPCQPDLTGNRLEVKLTVSPADTGDIEIALIHSPDEAEQTRIIYDRAGGLVSVDRSRSNRVGDVDDDMQPVPVVRETDEDVRLHILFDHSVIEIFVNGRTCLTSRIYPTHEGDAVLRISAPGTGAHLRTLDIWSLQTIW